PSVGLYFSLARHADAGSSVAFESALRMRISEVFLNPVLYWKSWLIPKGLALVFPWVGWMLLRRRSGNKYRALFFPFLVCVIAAVLVTLAPFPVRLLLLWLHQPIYFGHELVRVGKYLVVPTVLVAALSMEVIGRHIVQRVPMMKAIGP